VEVLAHDLPALLVTLATGDTLRPKIPRPSFPTVEWNNSLRHPTRSDINHLAGHALERDDRVVATWGTGGGSDCRAPVSETASETPILIDGWPYYDEDR